MKTLDESEKFNYLEFWKHVKWLDHIVTTNTNNVMKGTFEVLYRKKGMRSTTNPRKNSSQSSRRSKQNAKGILGVERRQCHGRCKHLKGPWKHIWVGRWYGYQNVPRSLKFPKTGFKVGTQRYDEYELQGWRRFLVT
jgi:hypothetical protein